MEFDKTPRSETNKPANISEASGELSASSKEKKKKRTSKKRISAPVPLEIIADEDKKSKGGEKALKSKKTKKRPKTTAVSEAGTPAAETSSAGNEAESTEKPSPKKAGKEQASVVPDAISEGAFVDEQMPESDESAHTVETSEKTDDTFAEKVILPHEVGEEEGELFVSDRLQQKLDRESDDSVPAPEQGAMDSEADEDDELPIVTATSTPASSPQATGSSTLPTSRSLGGSTAAPGTGQGRVPTPTTAGGGTAPPHTPPIAAQPAGFGGGPAAANLAPAAYTAAVPAAANRAPGRDRNAERRNLVAGIILGGVIEHIRHKRREKRMKAVHKKEVKELKKEQQFQQAENYQAEQKAKRTKTTLEQQIERLTQSVSKEKEAASQSEAGKVKNRKEKKSPQQEIQSTFYEEYKQKFRTSETTLVGRQDIHVPEKQAPAPEQLEPTDELLEVPPDRRVETSAWHRIEVDKKTGKAVENPTLAYGEEFQNEQHQEQLRRQIAEASVESEQVKKSYLPMVDKTTSTTVETHDPPVASQKAEPTSPVNNAFHTMRDKASDSSGLDIILWVVFFFIVLAIIALL